jgi:hypothetical protein
VRGGTPGRLKAFVAEFVPVKVDVIESTDRMKASLPETVKRLEG